MDVIQAICLALIQGITEFLPISSSAHLILPASLFGWPDQGLAFDTAVHLGSLIAVIGYFRSDLISLFRSLIALTATRQSSRESRFALNLGIASLPIIPVGFIFRFDIEAHLRTVPVIIVTTLVFAVFLLLADRIGKRSLKDDELNWKQALLIGVSQCLALVPGTSRSGITMTAALLSGFTREAAARISFLISIPSIAGAATLKIFDLASAPEPVDWWLLFLGGFLAMISAYVCIRLFVDFIARIGFLPFVIYRFVLGALLLLLII